MAGKMFIEAISFLFAWLPFPLNALVSGAFCLIVVVVIARLVVFFWELLPFN